MQAKNFQSDNTKNISEKNIARQYHNISPIYNEQSKILILGSFPSVKSRENQFFYGHLQNRFWKLLAKLFNCDTPVTIDEKKAFLLQNKLAVWDVIQSCDIIGSSDSSIKNVVPNDINIILKQADIRQIICNGNKSFQMYNKYLKHITQREAVCMPSTSPANAAFNLDKLADSWKFLLNNI